MEILNKVALIILIIGGMNWGLIGLFEFDLVAFLLGGQYSILSKLIYILVGISAIICIRFLLEPMDEKHKRPEVSSYRKDALQTEFSEEHEFKQKKK